eukprot:155770-Hanusia_phi.AAC.1
MHTQTSGGRCICKQTQGRVPVPQCRYIASRLCTDGGRIMGGGPWPRLWPGQYGHAGARLEP